MSNSKGFKYKIEPKWEDPVCANGGKWSTSFPRGKSDTLWLYTFDRGDEICGAVVNVRAKQEKIALWTKNASNKAAQLSIGRQCKEFLDYSDTIGFIFHEHERNMIELQKVRMSYDPGRDPLSEWCHATCSLSCHNFPCLSYIEDVVVTHLEETHRIN